MATKKTKKAAPKKRASRTKKTPAKKTTLHDMSKEQLVDRANKLALLVGSKKQFNRRQTFETLRKAIRQMMGMTKKPITRSDFVKLPDPEEESAFSDDQEINLDELPENPKTASLASLMSSKDTAKTLNAFVEKLDAIRGAEYNVGDEVTYRSFFSEITKKTGQYVIEAILIEKHGMRSYFLEGLDYPVAGMHLYPIPKPSDLKFS